MTNVIPFRTKPQPITWEELFENHAVLSRHYREHGYGGSVSDERLKAAFSAALRRADHRGIPE